MTNKKWQAISVHRELYDRIKNHAEQKSISLNEYLIRAVKCYEDSCKDEENLASLLRQNIEIMKVLSWILEHPEGVLLEELPPSLKAVFNINISEKNNKK